MSVTGTIRPPTSDIPIATGRTAAPFLRLLGSELWWMLRRPRTLVSLGLLALIPVVMGVGMALESGQPGGPMLMGLIEGSGTLVGLFALTMTLALLLPLLISVIAADSFAGEAAAGTLRGLLLAPVSRGMLVLVKTVSVFIFSVMAVFVVVIVGVVVGLVLLGGDSMITSSGHSIGLGESLSRMALIASWAILQMWAVAAIALAVSAMTHRPIVVTASVMGGFVGFQIITGFPQFDWLHPAVLTHRWLSAQNAMLSYPMDFTDLEISALRAVFYLLIGLSLTVWRVNSKDH
ncbi:ABC transporter permease [Actinoalloteichus hymeniacidonis]|uniref:ABC-2 family transporter protein n=1 Tax=Actinoalloteichus hymeniacidonis TaxID=340345 RepID=A0AAC9MW11_9PSEU|nr:ABC transporter permease [Actinoalloteichus hymeniacidonis]AOS61708.1 ABC-2 family transporter protein [Actinoalloteichus hymeniacidonis]MBB5910274.1 ABC-2 type transport system permease protein [Actinoalloteichus hymeniacidonis]